MKIIIVHGDDVEKSGVRLQKFIDSAKKRSWTIERINPDKDRLQDHLQSNTLFNTPRLFLLENAVKLKKEDAKWLKENSTALDETLVLYHTKLLTKTFINSLPPIDKVEVFELPKTIWKFLDSFFPGNAQRVYVLLHEAIEVDAAEFIFAMLSRHIKDMYQSLVDPKSMSAPEWRQSKLKSQASKFGEQKLKRLHQKFAEIDIKTKTSQAMTSDELDFLIATELE